MTHDRRRAGDYRLARIASAIGLVAAVVILLIVDAASATFEVDVQVVATVLGVAAVMLGIEFAGAFRRG